MTSMDTRLKKGYPQNGPNLNFIEKNLKEKKFGISVIESHLEKKSR